MLGCWAAATTCVEPIVNIDNDFETRAVVAEPVDFPSIGFRFQRTANTLPSVKLEDEFDSPAIQMRNVGNGGDEWGVSN